jgi:methyltransferase-like protein/protein-L-isoaspartate O-methyltransferase
VPDTANAYDSVLYPGGLYLQTHPDRQAAMGILFGMDAKAVERCRVLEIGCGHGSNLIAMAYGLPRSEFIGIDLAAKAIGSAQTRIERVGLTNIHFQHLDLMEIGPDFGQFDYIIAHGLYAWVPRPVKDKLLAVCNQNLSPNGIAFISYNANPGGHVRRALRDMMLFHTRRMEEPRERVQQGKSFVQKILETMDTRIPWRNVLEYEFKQMCERDDNVIYHDEYSPHFSPVYFADFIVHAEEHGLQFLSEARLVDLMVPQVKPEAHMALSELAGNDLIAYQQYVDFVRFRKFRQTLLCHREIHLRRDGIFDGLRRLLVASELKSSVEQEDGFSEFSSERGAGSIKTNKPVTIAVLRHLEQIWPRAERFDDLAGIACAQIPNARQDEVAEELSQMVLKLAAGTLVDLRTHHLLLAEGVSERPTASLLARTESQESQFVSTQLHTQVKFEDEQGRRFLRLLDGTRDRRALTEAVAADLPHILPELILGHVNSELVNLSRMGLLVA